MIKIITNNKQVIYTYVRTYGYKWSICRRVLSTKHSAATASRIATALQNVVLLKRQDGNMISSASKFAPTTAATHNKYALILRAITYWYHMCLSDSTTLTQLQVTKLFEYPYSYYQSTIAIGRPRQHLSTRCMLFIYKTKMSCVYCLMIADRIWRARRVGAKIWPRTLSRR